MSSTTGSPLEEANDSNGSDITAPESVTTKPNLPDTSSGESGKHDSEGHETHNHARATGVRPSRWSTEDTRKRKSRWESANTASDTIKQSFTSGLCSSEFEQMVKQKQKIFTELVTQMTLDNIAKKGCGLVRRIDVPTREYPDYNFIGLLIGPKGTSLKRLEVETGATIRLRGEGMKVKGHPELYVQIEADSQAAIDSASKKVKEMLKPVDDRFNVHKLSQLRELAILKGCSLCGDSGHMRCACPMNNSSLFSEEATGEIRCLLCGCHGHVVSACPMNCSTLNPIQAISQYRCSLCGDDGHMDLACPKLGSTSIPPQATSLCRCLLCGGQGHLQYTCPMRSTTFL